MFRSCCRGTQTGNDRCIYQALTHVNTNTNLHGTISPTTCTSIKYSTCKISNPRKTHDISPSDFKGAWYEATIHNNFWLLCSEIPTSKNLSKAGHQQREIYNRGDEYQLENRQAGTHVAAYIGYSPSCKTSSTIVVYWGLSCKLYPSMVYRENWGRNSPRTIHIVQVYIG